MDEDQEQPLSTYRVTCRTPDCHNEGATITVPGDPIEPYVVCGPCGQQITDVQPVEEG